MNNLSYAYEKFANAVSVLARSPSSIQDRLHSAYMSFHPVQAKDFKDPEMRSAYEEIIAALTEVRTAPPEKGYVPATLEQMSHSKASEVADKIVDLFFAIARSRFAD